jgi:ribosomal protein S18 acetylase RimI-like enzyme
MNIHIRPATPADATTIIEFNAAIAKETENIDLNRERLQRGVNALLTDPFKGIYYVAEVDGKVVGQLMITYEWSDWRNGFFWWIQSVYTDKAYRRMGIFKALYKHVEKIAHSSKDMCGLRLYVEEHNKHAQKTYESLGMKFTKYQIMDVDFTQS